MRLKRTEQFFAKTSVTLAEVNIFSKQICVLDCSHTTLYVGLQKTACKITRRNTIRLNLKNCL